MHLKIAHLNALAHLLQAFGQLGYKAHLDGGIDGRTLLLMRTIDRPAHIEIDIRGLLKEHARNLRSAIGLIAPFGIPLVILQIVL